MLEKHYFGSVSHITLLKQLIDLNLIPCLLKWVKSYESNLLESMNSIQTLYQLYLKFQGLFLGLLLFICHINSVAVSISPENMFADDIAFYIHAFCRKELLAASQFTCKCSKYTQ